MARRTRPLPSEPEGCVRAALAERRAGTRRWKACVARVVAAWPAARLMREAARLAPERRAVARHLAIDLWSAVATSRSPLWPLATRRLAAMRDDRAHDVEMHAVCAVIDATHARVATSTALRLTRSRDEWARSRGAVALGFVAGRVAREALLRLARDDSADVRESAVSALGWHDGDDDALDAIEAMVAEACDDTDPMVRWSAQLALGGLGGEAHPPLPLLLQRGYVDARALRHLIARRDVAFRPLLEGLRARFADDATPPHLRALLDEAIRASTALH